MRCFYEDGLVNIGEYLKCYFYRNYLWFLWIIYWCFSV